MDTKILSLVKEGLGIDPSVTGYDTELLIELNGANITLLDLGVIEAPVEIDAATTIGMLTSDPITLRILGSYLTLRTRIIFDPPASPTVAAAYANRIREIEERLAKG